VPETESHGINLMTVHGAKGLEFPIIAVCDLSARTSRGKSAYLETEEGEIVFKDSDATASGLKRQLTKSDHYQSAEAMEIRLCEEESRRLLYVALTRARDCLILPMPFPHPKKKTNRWSDLIV
jgi:ATP-dependent helicase/nuclease subunit A